MIMKYYKNGNLKNLIEKHKKENSKISNEIIIKYTKSLIDGLLYIHDKEIMHRDIKPANIFLSNNKNSLIIGDFGISHIGDLGKTYAGTPLYASPEVLNNQSIYSYKVDEWSLGCVLYELCTLNHPFFSRSLVELKINQRAGYEELPNYIPKYIKEIIDGFLIYNEESRLSVHDAFYKLLDNE